MTTTPVHIGSTSIGNGQFCIIAGPCAIESRSQFLETALAAKTSGACLLRGGIYKLRTNPKSFQGLGQEALEIAREVKSIVGLPLISEIVDPRHIEQFNDVVDAFQVGARNMHNSPLLKELGGCQKPVLLKRGFAATMEEWWFAAEYIAQHGNRDIILCERGIRTFERATRNTLDLAAVALSKQRTEFPVIVDPSHATGLPSLVAPMTLAAAAAGADGVMIEMHLDAQNSLSDGNQAIDAHAFTQLVAQLKPLLASLGRTLRS